MFNYLNYFQEMLPKKKEKKLYECDSINFLKKELRAALFLNLHNLMNK